MKYSKPNLDDEWMEALRYREFEKMGKEGWLKYASENYSIINYEKIKDVLNNVDLDYDTLEEDKKKRFEEAFEKGEVEIPIAVKFADNDYDLLGGNTRLAGLLKNGINPKLWIVDMTKEKSELKEKWSKKYKKSINCNNPKGFSQRAHCQGRKKKVEAKETDSSSSGAYSGPLFGKKDVIKRPINKIPNMDLSEQESEVGEATLSSSSGAYDVPLFGKTAQGGRRNPLKIDGPNSIYKGRAVIDKKFPKWGGPDSVFVKVKEKCKKFPYCNQGNTGAIEFIKEDSELQEAITYVSKKYGISHSKVEEIVLNEIKQIFI